MTSLPTPDELFLQYFTPWYPPERPPLQPGVGSDLEEIELQPGTPIGVLQGLDPESMSTVQGQLAGMNQAYAKDWPRLLGVEAPFGGEWIGAFEKHFDPAAIRDLLERSEPENFSNPFLIMCCECGCAVAAELQRRHPALQWLYEWPYWDSALFDLNSKVRLNVFHWAVKRMSGAWESEPLLAKIDASLGFITEPQ